MIFGLLKIARDLLDYSRKIFAVQIVIGLKKNFTQTALTDWIVLRVELVESVKRVSVLREKGESDAQIIFAELPRYFNVNIIREDTYCMHIQHVDAQIVCRQIHGLKNFAECHGLTSFGTSDHFVGVILQRFFDESKQVFLIHA